MGKFESYPSTNSLSDDDITLYNQDNLTHKITFGNLFTTIKNKLVQMGLISITTGAGLSGGTITSSGTIKCNLKSEVKSSYGALTPTDEADRLYAVKLDSQGKLAVSVPWTNSGGSSGMATDGSNAASHVTFDGSFTVGDRSQYDGVGAKSFAQGDTVVAEGECSSALGYFAAAYGDYSHAEGSGQAQGQFAHAEGCATNALGTYSHASGNYTIANYNQTVIGFYNEEQGSVDDFNTTDYAFIIGNGKDDNTRSNAFAVRWDGTLVFNNGTTLSPSEITQLKALIQ